MRSLPQFTLVLVCLFAAVGLGWQLAAGSPPAEQAAADRIDFSHQIVPILRRHCVSCHGGRENEGDFSINSRQAMLASGLAKPRDPLRSRMLELIQSDDPDMQMPPADRPRVPEEAVALLNRWIEQGLPWDEGFTFANRAYEPSLLPRQPALPKPRGDRDHPIDRILDHYMSERQIPIPEPIDDSTFARRAFLDLIGMLPSPDQLREFTDDPSAQKRERLIDDLLADQMAYAEHWLTFFNDLLRNDYSGTGFITGGRAQISKWLYESLLQNKPFDQLARELIAPPSPASRGFIDGIKWRGEVSAGQTIPIQFSQSIAQSFLGINMKCASCHDSFIDRWTLRDAYGLAAIYSDSPLALHRCDKPTGETQHALWLFPELGQIDPAAPRDQRLAQLATLMTHPQNGRFSRTMVNRLWYRLMGRGIVHPLDAMQSEPWNEDLLDYLAVHLAESRYDLKAVLRLIATSQAYQSQTEVVARDDPTQDYVYRGPRARRMTAEQFLDAVWQLTGDAPAKHDAPVFRTDVNPESVAALELKAQWIWGPVGNDSVPAGETILLRKVVNLDSDLASGGAILTCDNGYRLFINRRLESSGDDWTKLQSVVLTGKLKSGDNEIVVIASNAGSTPNPAGFYFDARLELANGDRRVIVSDDSWQYHTQVPASREGRFAAPNKGWQAAAAVASVRAWSAMVSRDGKPLLATILAGGHHLPMVRASLMKNNALMRSLGRPGREQIVSMRPAEFTTLEAMDLANEPNLSQSFARGAERLLAGDWESTEAMIRYMVLAAVAREPTTAEMTTLRETLGHAPSTGAVQDALWALCMLPEFLLVR